MSAKPRRTFVPPAAWSSWSAEERERQVSPSSTIGGDYEPFVTRYRHDSDEAVGLSPLAVLDLAVPASAARLDLFPAVHADDDAVVVFIHGGYWQELDRAHSRFPAVSLNDDGWAYLTLGYPLAPTATIEAMIDACAEALRWVRAELSPTALVVAGSSAGAHLAVSVATREGVQVDGIVAFSGVYELTPLLGTSVDDKLSLSRSQAERLSPLRDAPAMVPTLLAIGEHETEWFLNLHHLYAEHLRAYGVEITSHLAADRNHFDIVFELQDETSVTRHWLSALRDRPRAPTGP